MKPDYKNWMPKGMVLSSVVVTMLFLILFIISGLSGIVSGTIKTVLFFVFLAATVFGIGISLWMILMYRTFSYDGDRQMSRQIIEGIADYVKLPEGVKNTSFRRGNAVKLDFPDESFDAVVSNYVYHNIPGDRQAYLLETLRVLKKGGTFALHDIFSRSKYGDMNKFLKKLYALGYENVGLIDTTNGKFMTKKEAGWMMLSGSALLVGKK